jgi:hypothetical protein
VARAQWLSSFVEWLRFRCGLLLATPLVTRVVACGCAELLQLLAKDDKGIPSSLEYLKVAGVDDHEVLSFCGCPCSTSSRVLSATLQVLVGVLKSLEQGQYVALTASSVEREHACRPGRLVSQIPVSFEHRMVANSRRQTISGARIAGVRCVLCHSGHRHCASRPRCMSSLLVRSACLRLFHLYRLALARLLARSAFRSA